VVSLAQKVSKKFQKLSGEEAPAAHKERQAEELFSLEMEAVGAGPAPDLEFGLAVIEHGLQLC
jgi:hypothetical protein